MSQTKIGNPLSDTTKAKMSIAKAGENYPMFGKTHKKETLEKLSLARAGKKHNAGSLAKLSIAKAGGNNPPFIFNNRGLYLF